MTLCDRNHPVTIVCADPHCWLKDKNPLLRANRRAQRYYESWRKAVKMLCGKGRKGGRAT